MINVNKLATEVTRRAVAKNPQAKQKQVSVAQAAELIRVVLTLLAAEPAGDVGALLARYQGR